MGKRFFYIILLLFVPIVILKSFSAWAVPRLISYQGRLTDAGGVSLNGIYITRFRLFAEESNGSVLWSEQQDVTVMDGIYSVQLGAVNALSTDLFYMESLYLEVAIFNTSTGWEILSPRQRLISTAFAINADTVDGAEAADLEESDEIESKINTHTSDVDAHHPKTTSFSEITDTATDAQIPDDITIHYAANAGTSNTAHNANNANTLDGHDSMDFAPAAHTHLFAGLTGAATDAQIPDNITIQHAASASDADTVDGVHANELASITHHHDALYYKKAEVDSLIAALESRIAQLEAILVGVTRTGNDIEFSGVNVRIVNGSGTTDGEVNGLGNLIVGYNELRPSDNDRTGSHNIVVGKRHNYSSYAGLVVGSYNTISGAYASISGGYNNTASNDFSSVSGGQMNTASGNASSVSGGQNNTASAGSSSVSGGNHNTASGGSSSISGGYNNTASSSYASVSGGHTNTSSGNSSSVSGGRNNEASGSYAFVAGGGGASDNEGNNAFAYYSAILGGRSNIAGDPDLTNHTLGQASSVSGGANNEASGTSSSVSGGYYCKASGIYSSISAGWSNQATDQYSSVSGGYNNTASAYASSVSGGSGNTASGTISSVSGGGSNLASGGASSISGGHLHTASGDMSSISGGKYNTASGESSSVNGGYLNEASGESSLVSAGYKNTANGTYSCVSGGNNRSVNGEYDWRAGELFQGY